MFGLVLSVSSFFGDHGVAWLGTWLPLSILAVITAVIIHSILLMIGRAFSIKELEAFATSEMLQAAATAFMAIFLVAMVGSAMEVAQSFIRGEVACGTTPVRIGMGEASSTMDDAFAAIRCRLQARAVEVAGIQDTITSSQSTMDEFNVLNLAISTFGLTFFKGDWYDSLYQPPETKRITNNLATVLLIGLDAQSALLEYLRVNMLNVFIPVGILLRSFYFTRGPGALFIAIGIGMYFIFPVFFVLLDPGFVASPLPPTLNVPKHPTYCYGTMSNTVSLLTTLESAGLGSSADLTMGMVRDDLSKSYIALMLHPLVALFLTLIFVRYIISVLGGDTMEVMKMVGKVI